MIEKLWYQIQAPAVRWKNFTFDATLNNAIWLDVASHVTNFNQSEFMTSVTRLGDLLDFGQLFKACGNN